MTYEDDYSIPEEILEQICEDGFDAVPELIRIVLNAAMRIERQKHLGAEPYTRGRLFCPNSCPKVSKIMLTLLFDSGKIDVDQKENLLDLTLIKCGVADFLCHERRINRGTLFS